MATNRGGRGKIKKKWVATTGGGKGKISLFNSELNFVRHVDDVNTKEPNYDLYFSF